MLLPVPADVPPQEPVNHSATAPVPALPPTSVRVVLLPKQMFETPEILVGAVESVLTVINCEAQAVVLQSPSYRTKYVVLIEGETVILLPVPAIVPPHEPEYHLVVAPVPALPPTSVRVVLPPLQTVETPEILRGAVESVFTIIVISLDVTLNGDAQVAVEVICTLILSLLAKLLLINVLPVSPLSISPFLYH